ncbi:MAG: DUF4249 domain-containing protein [Bacteroidaceae bacterium]|nr:DUF4249 domain-containing protein [Bacteroidaceae bacterium]
MNRLLLYITSLFLFVSCDDDIFIESAPRIVVEGWIDAGGFPVVIVTESVPISDHYTDIKDLDNHVIKWAKVTVSDGERECILTGKSNSSYFPPYIYTTSEMRGEVGKNYRLTVSYEDYYAEAETTIPHKVSVKEIIAENNANGYSLKARIEDNPDEKNFYKFFIRMIDREKMYLSSNMSVIDDKEFTFPLDVPLGLGKSIIHSKEEQEHILDGSERLLIKFAQIDSIAYNFWNEYKNYIELGQNSFFRYTNNVYSNVKGGLGYWFGYGATEYLCEPYKHDTPIVLD